MIIKRWHCVRFIRHNTTVSIWLGCWIFHLRRCFCSVVVSKFLYHDYNHHPLKCYNQVSPLLEEVFLCFRMWCSNSAILFPTPPPFLWGAYIRDMVLGVQLEPVSWEKIPMMKVYVTASSSLISLLAMLSPPWPLIHFVGVVLFDVESWGLHISGLSGMDLKE